jgi:hypothetical protein
MSHLKTAHDLGVQKALKEAGYNSLEDVQKEAEAVGLIEKKASHPTDGLLSILGKK